MSPWGWFVAFMGWIAIATPLSILVGHLLSEASKNYDDIEYDPRKERW